MLHDPAQNLIRLESPRLLFREIVPGDEADLFRMDSDPEVHRYLGNRPVQSLEEMQAVIQMIRRQYTDFGIARWAAVRKEDSVFIGWAGFKFHTEVRNGHRDFYDLGYRLARRFWGTGYATEAALALTDYGFDVMKQEVLYACTHLENYASQRVLEKAGFLKKGTFKEDNETIYWLEQSREAYEKRKAAQP
ncbi:MAG: GNAT family N-acetyltransferase [Bacteroidia bacterium]|nr:GNAT family N-acetyltransferase [Bacteroidia bacterium]